MCVCVCVCVCVCDDCHILTDDGRLYQVNKNLNMKFVIDFTYEKYTRSMIRLYFIIVAYACAIHMQLSGPTPLQSSEKYGSITDDYANCRFYFRLPSLNLFPLKDTYKSVDI